MGYNEDIEATAEAIALCEELGAQLKQYGVTVPQPEPDAEGGRGYWFNAPDNGHPEVEKRTAWIVARNSGQILLMLYFGDEKQTTVVHNVVMDPSQARRYGPICVQDAACELRSHFVSTFSEKTAYSFAEWIKRSPNDVRNAWEKLIAGANGDEVPTPYVATADRTHTWNRSVEFHWERPVYDACMGTFMAHIEASVIDDGTVHWFAYASPPSSRLSWTACDEHDEMTEFSPQFYSLLKGVA